MPARLTQPSSRRLLRLSVGTSVAAWSLSLLMWAGRGHSVGIHPTWLFLVAVAMTATIVSAVLFVVPLAVVAYTAGAADMARAMTEHDDPGEPQRHLTVAR